MELESGIMVPGSWPVGSRVGTRQGTVLSQNSTIMNQAMNRTIIYRTIMNHHAIRHDGTSGQIPSEPGQLTPTPHPQGCI